jgi:hypothetical protein
MKHCRLASDRDLHTEMWQDNSNMYGSSSSQGPYYPQPDVQNVPLQFYDQSAFYPGSRSSLEGNVGPQGSIAQQGVSSVYGGNIQSAGGWWTAFGTGGFEGEPPLLEGMVCSLLHFSCANSWFRRTRDQFSAYQSQVHDRTESTASC